MGGLGMIVENEVSLEELDNFVLFRIYYDRMMCLDLNKKIQRMLNNIMNYHYVRVYGRIYKADLDIISHDFKCIYKIEK